MSDGPKNKEQSLSTSSCPESPDREAQAQTPAYRKQQLPERTVPELLELQQLRSPNQDALALGPWTMSYEQLHEKANRLAHYLIENGAGPESLIGICMERCPDMIIAMLAILKAGAAYLPLDPRYPAERLLYIVREASPFAILTTSSSRSALPSKHPDVMVIDHITANLPPTHSNPTNGDRIEPLFPEHPAYVIYTSGTTGKPKGIVVTHTGAAALVHTQQERLGVSSRSRVLQFASLSFDASFWEIMMALATGATLVLRRDEEWGGTALQGLLAAQNITHATLPPSVLETLNDNHALALESLIVAGESCPSSLLSWSQHRRMFNAYGPTETTVCATISKPLSTGTSPAIGQPVDDASVYVLDKWLNPVPLGVPGELHVAGPALARGYLNSSYLTAEKFIPDPFGPSGSRMYCTGDRVRWRRDGELEFLGRIDQQLKIRGFRIEPGEIETLLVQHPMVSKAVVIARQDQSGEKRLVAYIVAAPDQIVDRAALQQYLLQKLPGYMVPSALVVLAALPLGPTGKIDRNALPNPDVTDANISHPAALEGMEPLSFLS